MHGARTWLAGALMALLTACAQLPPLDGRAPSSSLTDTQDTALGQGLAPALAGHPGQSGIQPLPDPLDAFAARVLLARAAERSLDVQYYIWHEDRSGTLLFAALHEAAERGVRVRLLLDDNNTGGLDPTIAVLDAHPNIEVRLFNPFPMRNARMLGFLTDFSRLNRRMHNKSFTADNQVTIVGGRNIGDEYFAAGEGVLFADLDVAACGPVVPTVSSEFDRYWQSESAYPADRIVPPADAQVTSDVKARFLAIGAEPGTAAYAEALKRSGLVNDLLHGRLDWRWAKTQLVIDDPAKALDKAEGQALMLNQMGQVIGEPRSRVDLISPYFVPEEEGTATFAAMARRGVAVRILTNALESNDVAAVHAGYSKWRKPLLESGVRLYELKRSAAPERPRGKGTAPEKDKSKGVGGSSAASLHAKTFAVDAERAFVGSFNFDPRSARLNTELGVIIDSPPLAQGIVDALDRQLPEVAYEVQLDEAGDLVWLDHVGGTVVRHSHDPGVSVFKRGLVKVLSWLPIDALL